MKPVDVPEPEEGSDLRKVVYAKDQPQYNPLPTLVYPDGVVLSRWEMTETERRAIVDGARVELFVWTFGRALQPVRLRIEGVEEAAVAERPPGRPPGHPERPVG